MNTVLKQNSTFRIRALSLCMAAALFFYSAPQSLAVAQTETGEQADIEGWSVSGGGFSMSSDFDFSRDFFGQNSGGVAKKLKVLDGHMLSVAEKMLALSLQGILAKKQAQIYIIESDTYAFWLEDLKQNWDIDYEMVPGNDVWALCAEFKDAVAENGYIKYKAETGSVNAATVIAGQERYLMVEESLTQRANEAGFLQKADATDSAVSSGVFSRYKSTLNRSMLFFQNPALAATRDFGIAQGLFYGYPKDHTEYDSYLDFLDENGVLMGWHSDEVSGVKRASQSAAITMASDHSYNLSLFSNLPRQVFTQKETKDNSRPGKVHYVTMILSDGDNVQWYENGALQNKENFASERRGEIPFGWTFPPAMADLAPNILRYAYDSATENDHFVTAVSGFGYISPSIYPLDALRVYAERTNYYMEKTGSQYVELLDNELASPAEEVMDAFTSQPQLQGVFYETGNRYVEAHGKIWWSNAKPFVSIRETLWAVKEGKERNPYDMARRISTYNKNPASISGYTAVNVHVWTHSYEDCLKMVQWWQEHDPNVAVVTPDQFMKLIAGNVPQEDASPRVNILNYITFAFRAIGSVVSGIVTRFKTGSYENTFFRKS
jgi:hypothetical protein